MGRHGTVRKLAGIGTLLAGLMIVVVVSITAVLLFRMGRRLGIVGVVVWLLGNIVDDIRSSIMDALRTLAFVDDAPRAGDWEGVVARTHDGEGLR